MPKLCAFGCSPSDVPMHRFPNRRKFPENFKAWVSSVGGKLQRVSDYEFYQKKIVCDIHFTDKDRVRNNRLSALAVPSLHLHGSPHHLTSDPVSSKKDHNDAADDLDEPGTLKACRICLATNTKMYHMRSFKIDEMYEEITGLMVDEDERLPQYVCWECRARLTAAVKLRHKAFQADALLYQLIEQTNNIKINDIKSLDRTEKGLESCLTICVIQEIFENSDNPLNVASEETDKETQEDDTEMEEIEYLDEDLADLKEKHVEKKTDGKKQDKSNNKVKQTHENKTLCENNTKALNNGRKRSKINKEIEFIEVNIPVKRNKEEKFKDIIISQKVDEKQVRRILQRNVKTEMRKGNVGQEKKINGNGVKKKHCTLAMNKSNKRRKMSNEE